ncbi:unnamed protein product [Closterium sp. NIES-53]
MAGFEDFCASLGLSVGIGKFLVCYLISIPCCFLQRLLPAGTVRHIWATLSGLVLTYIAFGYESLGHCVVACVVAYGSMLVYRKKCGVITFFTTFIYLIGCHVFYMSGDSWRQGNIDFTGAMMILVLKVTSVAYDYQDGGKPRKPEDAKTAAISDAPKPIVAMPSLLQFLGYTFCCGLHFAGPFYDFSAYNDWINRKGIWAPGTRTAPALVPFLRAFIQGIVAAVIQLKLASILDIDILKTPSVYFAMPYWRRFLFIYHACEVTRWKYYFIWSISESAMIAAGLGFSGWVRKIGKGDEGGKENGGKADGEGKEKRVGGSFTEVASWKRAQNCHILGVELATSTATLATNWNISVGLWLRTYVYERLVPAGGKPAFVHLLLTQIVSALWHGLYPGYLLFFVGVALEIAGSRGSAHAVSPSTRVTTARYVIRRHQFAVSRFLVRFLSSTRRRTAKSSSAIRRMAKSSSADRGMAKWSRGSSISSLSVAHSGVAVAGDMECTGSSCSPPKPPFKPEPLVEGRGIGSTLPLPRTHPSLCGRAGGSGGRGGGEHSTRLGWDGRVSGLGFLKQGEPLFPRTLLLLLGLLSMLTSVFAPSLPLCFCMLLSPFSPLSLAPLPPSLMPPSQYIEGCSRAAGGSRGAAAGQQLRGGVWQRQRQGVVWLQVRYGKLIPSSLSLPSFSLQAEGGSTGARAGEWSPPSHSPPPLSLFPSLPAAPCLDHRGVSPFPNPPFSSPLPSSLSIMALCTAAVGIGKYAWGADRPVALVRVSSSYVRGGI